MTGIFFARKFSCTGLDIDNGFSQEMPSRLRPLKEKRQVRVRNGKRREEVEQAAVF